MIPIRFSMLCLIKFGLQILRKDYVKKHKWSITHRPSFASSINNRHNNIHSIHIDQEEDYEDNNFDLHQESYYDNSDDTMKDLQVNGLEYNINLNVLDISIEKFEEQRLCMLKDLKALKARTFSIGWLLATIAYWNKIVENFMSTNVKKYDKSYNIFNLGETNRREKKMAQWQRYSFRFLMQLIRIL